MDDECCAVCAEPLEWTGYGPCGHLHTCSKCVARLRFTLKDRRCAICQQESDVVVFTRYMAEFTNKLNAEQFSTLQSGNNYKYLSIINGYFDNVTEYETIRRLCSYTHPEAQGGIDRKFANLNELKKHLKEELGKQFCDICLKGRKVFVCDQMLYTAAEARRHMSRGDLTGPLAEAGFKGHPICEFCRSRFYSDTELAKHNNERHETCFICRRDNPAVRCYYRDYDHLSEHFRERHFPCAHPNCVAARFVVFPTHEELTHHFRFEHESRDGPRSQRRDATKIQTNFQYRRPDTRGRGRGRFQLDSRQEYAPSNRDDRVSASEIDGIPEQRLVQLTEEDFPSFTEQTPNAVQGTWPVKGGRQGRVLRQDSFPSLPGHQSSTPNTSKPKGRTMASRIAVSRPPAKPLPNPNLQPMRNDRITPLPIPDNSLSEPRPEWPVRKGKEVSPEPKQQQQPRWVTLSKKPEDKNAKNAFPALTPETGNGVLKTGQKWERLRDKPKSEPPPPQPAAPSINDTSAFPSLGRSQATSSQLPAKDEQQTSRAKMSEGLKAANRELMKKLKDQMDAVTFQEFHREADVFLKDSLSAEVFHTRLVNHGLAHYISEIASLCPDRAKQTALLNVHFQFIKQCNKDPDQAPVFVPLSVLETAYQRAVDHPVWTCPRCATLNLSETDFCEACDASRNETRYQAAARPDPIPVVYRRQRRPPRTLFNVDDGKRPANVWAKKS